MYDDKFNGMLRKSFNPELQTQDGMDCEENKFLISE
jgi:hypothetical protein